MQLCEDLGIDPASVSSFQLLEVGESAGEADWVPLGLGYPAQRQDPVLFCLAADLDSKTVGEWAKDPWIKGWRAISPE
jgi:hypothetical protein